MTGILSSNDIHYGWRQIVESMSMADELAKLADLRDRGLISQKELNGQKRDHNCNDAKGDHDAI
jgi:hypothetical protein